MGIVRKRVHLLARRTAVGGDYGPRGLKGRLAPRRQEHEYRRARRSPLLKVKFPAIKRAHGGCRKRIARSIGLGERLARSSCAVHPIGARRTRGDERRVEAFICEMPDILDPPIPT